MAFKRRLGFLGSAIGLLFLSGGCGGGPQAAVLRADAQFDPPTPATVSRPINEANRAVAQTFTVEQDGQLDEFWVVVTDGASVDDGTIRITVQPVSAGGVIDFNLASSIIAPILVNTSTLPPMANEIFTEFSLNGQTAQEVLVGERYAIVVEFVSRATSTDVNPIALVLGQLAAPGDPYAGGAGATGQLGVGFTNNTEDYFFRTFVLN